MRFVKLFLFLAILGFAGHASAQSSNDLKRKREALMREIESLDKSLRQTSDSKRLSQKQINELNAKIRLRQQKINTVNSEIKLLDNQISDNTNTIRSLQSQLNKLKKEYAGMVLFAFRNQSAHSKLMFVFASADFNQAYKRLKYLQQFSEYRKKQARYIEGTQKNLGVKIVELDHNKKDKSDLLHAQEKEKQLQVKEKATQSKVLSSLSKQEKQYAQELSQKQRDAAQLNRAIQNAINKEIEAARKAAAAENKESPGSRTISSGSAMLAATPEAAKLSADFLDNRGKLPYPVSNGVIVEQFGEHTYGVNVKVQNDGVDIKTNEGASIRAVFSGVVRAVMNLSGTKTVMIMHADYFTIYSNLRSVSVSVGQKVSTKQAIGTVATDPLDGTTQVHFEVRKGASAMNPESWLARQ
jgi:septal ring factor EnvC (AmiA/AmiB activator)